MDATQRWMTTLRWCLPGGTINISIVYKLNTPPQLQCREVSSTWYDMTSSLVWLPVRPLSNHHQQIQDHNIDQGSLECTYKTIKHWSLLEMSSFMFIFFHHCSQGYARGHCSQGNSNLNLKGEPWRKRYPRLVRSKLEIAENHSCKKIWNCWESLTWTQK